MESISGQEDVLIVRPSTKHLRKTSVEENHTQEYHFSIGTPTAITGEASRHTQSDTGWAWVVLFATFWCHTIIGGLQHTSGIVRYALQEYIRKENLGYVSWLGSIYCGLISLTGPLSSSMVYKLGCRVTVLIGTILETVGFPYVSILRNSNFLIFLFSIACSSAAEGVVYLMLPGYLISQGSSQDQAATVLSLVGVSSTLTRFLMGVLANAGVANIFLLFLAPYGILGVFTLLLPLYAHLMAGRIIYGIIFGFYNCSVYALLTQLTVRITGLDHLAAAFGLEMFVWGLTWILGTPLADSIVQWTGSFSSAFSFAGSMYVTSAVAALFLLPKGEN